jgi:site-specific DNA recombinase
MTTKSALARSAIEAPEEVERVATKRAFAYVRVSSEAQTNTGFARDGLSIGAQREAADDKAKLLGADLVHVWSDPGKSAYVDLHKRVEFLEMLDELKRLNLNPATRIDYLIVWSLSRWARNVQDHHRTRELVRQAGARIVSITEPMIGEDETPESFYMEGMFALNNQYESMKTGRNVSKGILQKAKEGGTYGPAKLGYINGADLLPDGRKVACVSFDPERQPFLTTAFKLFATGEYSVSSLEDELYDLGLRSRPNRRHPNSTGKVKGSTLHRLLRDAYYAGWIVYKAGTPDEQTFKARHEPLIDQDTFDQVQELLDLARVSGERVQKHNHYLKGTVYCGDCGGRLTYGVSRGKSGEQYAYLFCSSRLRSRECAMRANMAPELVEAAIEQVYATGPVQLDREQLAQRTKAIEALAEVSQQAVAKVRAAKSELIDKLEGEQVRLLRLQAEEGGAVSAGAFRKERERMDREIAAANKSLAATEQQMNFDAGLLRMALELAEDIGEVYKTADPQLKRGFNQAFFKRIYVVGHCAKESGERAVHVTGVDLTTPYAVLTAKSFTPKARSAVAWLRDEDSKKEGSPGGATFLRSVFDLQAFGGERGIRTLAGDCSPLSI